MSTYAVTGSASGMGAAVAESLRAAGHTVIGIDRPGTDADITADLSTPDGRHAAIVGVIERCDGRLDGAVLAAGLGPRRGQEGTRGRGEPRIGRVYQGFTLFRGLS